MASKLKLANEREVLKDFANYEKKTSKAFQESLDQTAMLIRSNQWSILRAKVKKWTGNLAGSIKIQKKGKDRLIGPVGVLYDNWIEIGGRGGFTGYHYVRDSIKNVKRIFTNKLKKDIERSTK